MSDFAAVRAEARELGINSFGKGKEELEHEIALAKGEAPKKGRASWKPARMLDVRNKKPGLRYRWVDKDPQRVEKMLAEGWQFMDRTTGEHIDPKLIDGGKLPDGSNSYRDGVVMTLDEETAQERDAYYAQKAKDQLAGVNRRAEADLKKNVGDLANAHGGKLVIT